MHSRMPWRVALLAAIVVALSYSGSHVEVTIKGGNTISYSNFGMTISPPASEHYGDETFHGVVTRQR